MEDHFGDMDFKVAGTSEGITAIQLDIKVQNISPDVIETTLKQARQARMEILDRMAETIAEPREEMSPYAPRMVTIKIPVDKIGAVIGPGGKTIRSIVDETKATVDVQDDGSVVIGSPDQEATKKAIEIIEGLTKEAKVGDVYTGKVVRVMNFGAFVQILPGVDGMVHISELANEHVPTVEDVVREGDEVTVEVIGVDPSGRISLSRRSLLDGGEGRPREREGGGEGRPPEREGAAIDRAAVDLAATDDPGETVGTVAMDPARAPEGTAGPAGREGPGSPDGGPATEGGRRCLPINVVVTARWARWASRFCRPSRARMTCTPWQAWIMPRMTLPSPHPTGPCRCRCRRPWPMYWTGSTSWWTSRTPTGLGSDQGCGPEQGQRRHRVHRHPAGRTR